MRKSKIEPFTEFTMNFRNFKILKPLFVLLFLLSATTAWPQVGNYFGQNKVLYKEFEWAVFRTDHFDVYYYPEEKQAAHDAARMAERGYRYLSGTLKHEIKDRVPLILYASLNDFQQTNIIHGLISQGTRGVTEGYKNRVVIPLTGAYRDLNHVLVHELVHAFQFDMMLKGRLRNTNFNPPLWFVEGMAEYLSISMDNTTRMWVRDGFLNDKLLTVSQLNSTNDIRVYRLGESLWHYIGETRGKQIVGDVFKNALRTNDLESAFKSILKVDSKQLTEAWHEHARNLVTTQNDSLDDPGKIAEKLTRQHGYYHRINLAPAVSPDGNNIVYVANKNLDDGIYLLSKQEDGTWKETQLLEGGKSQSFEELRYFESTISWSVDGKNVAFISKSGKDDVLYVMDPFDRKVLHKVAIPVLNGMQSPTFSPGGDEIALVGIQGGISNLYILNLESRELRQLTDDRFAVFHPKWSPDGKTIAFVTDRGPDSNEKQLLFSDYDLALYRIQDHSITLLTNLNGNATNPHWSDDGGEIAFISDFQGIPNIYRIKLAQKRIDPVTKLKNGVAGISETTPAFSWSANGEFMVFSTFEKNMWNIYRLEVKDQQRELVPVRLEHFVMEDLRGTPDTAVNSDLSHYSIMRGKRWVPEIPDQNDLYSGYELVEEDSVESREYSSRFNLDAIALGGGYDTYFGAGGQAEFLFTDIMGKHNLYIGSAMQFSDILHSNFSATYFNLGSRINYGIQAFQANALYLTGLGFNTSQYLRYTYRGFNGLVGYPFSRFSRIEFSAGLTWIDADFVQERYGFSDLDRQTSDLSIYNYAQFGTALVFDNTLYGPLGPTNGTRRRFSVELTANDFNFTNLFADYRRYFGFSHRSVLAWRLAGAASVGQDQQYFFIGGPYTYRGADYDQLVGSRFLLSNLEFRFPLFPFLPPTFDWLSAGAFIDAAGAWGVDAPGYSKLTFQPFTSDAGFRLKDLNAAVGLAARLNMGYFVIGYHVAWPTDLRSTGGPIHQFSLGSLF